MRLNGSAMGAHRLRYGLALVLAAGTLLLPAGAAHAHATAGTVPAAAQPDARTTARTEALRTGKPVPVADLTTATSTTTANPDGSFTTTTSTLPTRMRAGAGWTTIDPTLRRGPDGLLRTAATPNALALSGGGRGALASVADGSGHVLGFGLPDALPVPTVSGASATYQSVYPGIDLVVTAQPSGGFGEVFVLHDAAAAARARNLRLAARLQGLTLTADGTGQLRAVDSTTGDPVATAAAPTMWDSTDPTSTAAAPGPAAHVAAVPVAVDGSGLTLSGDVTRLAGPVRYPVYVDPTWTLPYQSGGTQAEDEVQSGCPTSRNFNQDSQPGVGYNDFESCVGAFESYFQINTSNVINPAYVIRSATLKINEVFSAWNSCGQGSETISIYTTSPIGSGTDWANKPGLGAKITSKSLKSVGNSVGTMCSGGTVPGDFDVLGGVNQARANNWPNWTFAMVGNETAGSHSLERFNNNPSITTIYDVVPDVPSSLAASPTPVTAAGAAQPCGGSGTGYLALSNLGGQHLATLSAKLTSAVAAAQMQATFTVTDVTTGTVTVLTSSGYVTTGGTVSVQTPTLLDGHTYQWRVHSTDQYYTSAESATCQFVVDQTPPSSPSVSSVDYPPAGSATGTVRRFGQPGNNSGSITFSATDATPSSGGGSGLKGFYYSLDTPLPASGATLHPATNGGLTVTVTPGHWGTTVLYAESVDNAGNVSGQTQYDFYEPWYPGAKVVAGDLTNDGIPDVTSTTASGNLVEYPGDADPGAAPLTLSTPAGSPNAQGTPWNQYLVSHRGSFTNQTSDDLWAFDTTAHHLFLYKYVGATPFQNPADALDVTKHEVIVNDGGGCVPTASTGSCADFDTSGWTGLTKVLAVGDFYKGSPLDVPGTNDLLTVENGHLWLYRGQPTNFYLNVAVELGTTGWGSVALMAPGLVNGQPTLWARDNNTGTVYSYTITFDANGYPVGLGAALATGTTLTIPDGATLSWGNDPDIASPGDLHGTGNPDLVVTNSAGTLIDYPGAAPSGNLATFGNPVPLGSPPGPSHQWPLNDGPGTAGAADTAGTVSTLGGMVGYFNGTVSWPTDPVRGTVAGFNGTDTVLYLARNMSNSVPAQTLSLSFQAAAGSTGILYSTGSAWPSSLNQNAMPVMYIGTDGKLYAQFHTDGTVNPIVTPNPVNDGAWHTVTLVGDTLGQTLYLDGHPVRWAAGAVHPLDAFDYAGGGTFNATHAWVNAPGGNTTLHASYFTGNISNIVFYDRALTAAQLGATVDKATFRFDGTAFPSGTRWFSAKTTMTFSQGLLSLTDANTGALLATRGVSGYPHAVLSLDASGALGIYTDSTKAHGLWSSGSTAAGGSMVLQADGNLVILNTAGGVVWSTNTAH